MAKSAPRRWPLMLVAAPAAVAVWSGWVGLGTLAGFGIVHPLPGIADGFQLNTAITLPVGVEAYGAYALGAWLTPATPPAARVFARRSALGALAIGMLGQVVYHLLAAAHAGRAPWPVTMAVSCLPVLTLGLAAGLTHLLRAEAPTVVLPATVSGAIPEAISGATQEATDEPAQGAINGPPSGATDEPGPGAIEGPAGEPSSAPVAGPLPGPRPEPRERAIRPSKDPEAERARRAYRKSVREGAPLTDRALAAMFPGRSRNWGKARIREVDDAGLSEVPGAAGAR